MVPKELASAGIAVCSIIIVFIALKIGKGAVQIILFCAALLLILLSMGIVFVADAKKDGIPQAIVNFLVGWLLWP